jgi:hypothetical protein
MKTLLLLGCGFVEDRDTGRRVRLTKMSGQLLELFVGHLVLSYCEIDELLWPDAKVEPQQISAHMVRLNRTIRAGLGFDQDVLKCACGSGLFLNDEEYELALEVRTKARIVPIHVAALAIEAVGI